MLTSIPGICYYFLIDLPGKAWRAIFGKGFWGRWWSSRYH
jgi:hypothetical protein